MKRLLAVILSVSVLASTPAYSQSNDDDYTPLNSRIKRSQQFPTDLHNPWGDQDNKVARARSKMMLNQLSKCLYNHSREASLQLLEKTDYGFTSFEQIGLDNNRALNIYGFNDCLSRVATTNGTGVQLRFSAGGLRQWLVQEAYFDRFPDAPTWLKGGNVVAAREFPLSAQQPGILSAMDVADCIVVSDPYTADFFFRTASGSEDEKKALQALVPSLGPCLPAGQQFQLQPILLRTWMGEALWHAAMHSTSAVAGSAESAN